MGWLYRYSIRHPWQVTAIAALITLAIAPGVVRLAIRTDGHALVPTHALEVQIDRAIREEFATEDPIVVLVKSEDPGGIFNVHTLRLIQDLTDEFGKIEGIRPTDLFSLATEHGHRVRPGTLKARRFLEPLPTTSERLDQLRDDLRRIELYTGTLVSYDEKATSILVGVPFEMRRTDLYHIIRDIIAARQPFPEEIHVIGAPVAEALLGTHILEDLGVPATVLGHQAGPRQSAGEWRWPTDLYELRLLVARHIGLVPVAIAVMALVFLLCFRSLAGVILPLAEVGACLVFVFGLMGWLGVPVYLTIAVMPIILTAMGVADEIHIVDRYRRLLRPGPSEDHPRVVHTTMTEMSAPVVKTSITTAVGFLSFALSPIGPVRAFGVFTAIGITFCMLWSLTVIPAWLTLMPPGWLVRTRNTGADADPAGKRTLSSRVAAAVVRYRYAVLFLTILVVVVAPFGVRRIVIQDSWIDGFAPDSEFYRATSYCNEQFLGTHLLLLALDAGHELLVGELDGAAVDHHEVHLPADLIPDPEALVGQRITLRRTGPPPQTNRLDSRRRFPREWSAWIETARREGGHVVISGGRRAGSPKIVLRPSAGRKIPYKIAPYPLMTPEVLNRIEEFEAFVESHRGDAVGGVIGTADYVATTNLMARALREEQRCIPGDSNRIKWVWSQYQRIRGEERRAQIVDSNYARSLITVFMKNANFVDTAHLMKDIREYERTHLNPHGISLEFAGDVAVSQTLIGAIVTTQTRSLLVSLVGILAVTTLLSRSVRWGLLCVLPCAFAVLIDFAVMGAIGMPLGVATSMFAGMTLGIGVDFAIHLLERYRFARRRGLESEAALNDAMVSTGPAILIDALAVALGFGVLTLSQVPANARLGGLVVLSILGCFVATLLLLPALLSIFAPGMSGSQASGGTPDREDYAQLREEVPAEGFFSRGQPADARLHG